MTGPWTELRFQYGRHVAKRACQAHAALLLIVGTFMPIFRITDAQERGDCP